MATKVNKGDFFRLREELETKMSIVEVERREDVMEGKIDNFENVLRAQTKVLNIIESQMDIAIKDGVKRAN